METTPACRECKRTHTSMGNPVKLIFKGEREGVCKACMKRLVYDPPPPRATLAPELADPGLSYYLERRRERIARHQKRVNVPLSH